MMATQGFWAEQRMAQMSAAGVNLLCGPPSSPLSAEAKAALRDIAALLGQDNDAPDTPAMQHCQDCIMASFDIITPAAHPHILEKNHAAIQRDGIKPARFTHSCNGPPLGSRAPPLTA